MAGFKIPELRLPPGFSFNNSNDPPRTLQFHGGVSAGPGLLSIPHGPTPRRRHSWICR